MGILSSIRYAIGDRQSQNQIAAAEGGGKHRKGKGGKHEKPRTCTFTWEDPGIPGSKHATYPHKNHKCGDEPHNRGTHHCWGGEGWTCNATHA